MTLMKELEVLRGSPIQLFDGDPMDIPCVETSDSERLCKNPVVTVHMMTYNQAPYVRQAIEGVMMQKTDFDFELIVGDDGSTDGTREICFEYQKKYPDKIRVLWWHENLYRYGGNAKRAHARWRGEFIAFCEGDDYWTDPQKLQKQVDLIRKTNAAMCVADTEWRYKDGTVSVEKYNGTRTLLGLKDLLGKHYFHTTTYLLRRSAWGKCVAKHPEIIIWYDIVVLLLMAETGKICYLNDVVSAYRVGNGISAFGEDDNRHINMLIEQHIQFAWCRNRKISRFYARKGIKLMMKNIVLARKNGKFNYDLDFRQRIFALARSMAWRKLGLYGLLRFYSKYGIKKPMS